MKKSEFDVILFDLGGVIVQLIGVQIMLEWSPLNLSESELWSRWLSSPSVRRFESGNASPEEFAAALIDEFRLTVSPEKFLQEFTYWPRKPYPEAEPLLKKLRAYYQLAVFSNTNEIHWGRFITEMREISELFHHAFASHEIGLLKPDREAFNHVIGHLNKPPDRILFFDDNIINVEAGNAAGMHCYQVSGIVEIPPLLVDLGILDQNGTVIMPEDER